MTSTAHRISSPVLAAQCVGCGEIIRHDGWWIKKSGPNCTLPVTFGRQQHQQSRCIRFSTLRKCTGRRPKTTNKTNGRSGAAIRPSYDQPHLPLPPPPSSPATPPPPSPLSPPHDDSSIRIERVTGKRRFRLNWSFGTVSGACRTGVQPGSVRCGAFTYSADL